MDKQTRDYALKEMANRKKECTKYAAGGAAKIRKDVATKEGNAVKKSPKK
jgi:hypothetical protein